MKRIISFAVVVSAFSLGSASAQQTPATADASRRDAVVMQAMRTYQQGLAGIKEAAEAAAAAQPGTSSDTLREIRLEEAVDLALEKNLDIQVAKLEPQSTDFLIAGVRNLYRPNLSSTLGLRDTYQLPTSSLNGGTKVNNGTRTYKFGIAQNVNKYGGNYTLNWTNSRLETSNSFSNFNPSFQTNLVAAYTQPLMRGFKIDNTRQQLLINTINRDISEESAKATVVQTLESSRSPEMLRIACVNWAIVGCTP